MASVPAAPKEGGLNQREIGFMTESDGVSALRAVLSTTSGSSFETEGQRVGALAVGGLDAEDAAFSVYPITISGVRRDTPIDVDEGDVVALITDGNGRLIVTGAAENGAAVKGAPIRMGGVYRSVPQSLADGNVGDFYIDAAGRLRVSQESSSTADEGSGGSDISNVSEEVVASNVDRRYAAFVNRSSVWIFLAFGEAAVAERGIALAPNGGSFELTNTNMFTGAVNAITAVAGTNRLCFVEW
jgi:hypothetical protein